MRLEYDDLGRLTKVWRQTEPSTGEATKKYTYYWWVPGVTPAAVRSEQLQTPAPNPTYADAYSWVDGFGRSIQSATKSPTQVANAVARTSTSYDGSGHTFQTSAPQATTGDYTVYQPPVWSNISSYHQFTYDELGRVTRDSLKALSATKWNNDTSYDGWTHSTNPPVGGDTTYTNDAHGNLTRVTEFSNAGAQINTIYGYDLAGRRTDITDDSLHHTHTVYDWLGPQDPER